MLLMLIVFHEAMFREAMGHRFGGAGARPPLGECPPKPRGAKRRLALVRNAAPVGRLAVGPVPSAEGNRRPHDAGRHAFRRFTAAFSFDLETAFWKRTGAAFTERP